MRTTLKLEAESYAKALKDIRDANANAQSIEVSYVPGEAHEEVSRYFLKYPNFELNAYALKDRKYDLSKYQHTVNFRVSQASTWLPRCPKAAKARPP